ncbi:NAD(P)-dependent oxidoreductase [Sphingomonas sp. CGMCC 1.13654]|uniref:NAD(P)-dependent oxidoreductase n=1 Tax=Sphingomonas chungangi TaxID=2683589 RepID=A0A838L1G1_9SPHN|nr:NAD(P)-dependent oxidoreductase [Sphingomonas chungangi]MBA2933024.1 NAD(P)-dependent oxidoreductase [Sphingomonas chungangi]MVW56644.1 NAD-binding protein [Sphingomonas chungangi]
MKSVAIIGLGEIGSGVAGALGRHGGFALAGFDVNGEALRAVEGVVQGRPSPAQAADGVDVALIAVMNDGQTRDVLTGPGGVLTSANPPKAIAILSTVSVETILWAADAAAAKGTALVDCGVSGGRQALREASITSMVGGSDEAFERVRDVIAGFSDPVVHCGGLGNGMRAKLARNLIIYTDWMVAWEGTRLALAAGVPLDKFVQVVTASDRWVRPHMALVEKGTGLTDGDAGRDARTAAYADKDLQAALALGAELGMALPAAELARKRFGSVAGCE